VPCIRDSDEPAHRGQLANSDRTAVVAGCAKQEGWRCVVRLCPWGLLERSRRLARRQGVRWVDPDLSPPTGSGANSQTASRPTLARRVARKYRAAADTWEISPSSSNHKSQISHATRDCRQRSLLQAGGVRGCGHQRGPVADEMFPQADRSTTHCPIA